MKPNFKSNFKYQKKENPHKIDDFIRATTVRLVGEGTSDIVELSYALKQADSLNLNLVEINGQVNPPIVKIMDYKKFLYEQEKNKKNTKGPTTKEIQLTSNTGQNDIDVKMKKILEFLDKGHKVKIVMKFLGRNIQFVSRGEEMLLRMAEKLAEVGKIEQLPKLEGKNMLLYVAPKPKNK